MQAQKFDLCIVDDAGTINEPLTLSPILRSDRFVLFGNYVQQHPKTRSKLAAKKGLGVSLLERMSKRKSTRVSVIKKQHRMTKQIMIYVNKLLGRLEVPMNQPVAKVQEELSM